jgi:hypothetical protein
MLRYDSAHITEIIASKRSQQNPICSWLRLSTLNNHPQLQQFYHKPLTMHERAVCIVLCAKRRRSRADLAR